jgi:hypothetical protein
MRRSLHALAENVNKSFPSRRREPADMRPWQFSLLSLLAFVTVVAVLLGVAKTFPFESFLFLAILAGATLAVLLYVGQLTIVAWITDLSDWLATAGIHGRQPPLDYEEAGAIVVVKLSDNLVTARQCRWAEKQLQRLIAEQRCDLVLDFSGIERISSRFRDTMIRLAAAARQEAARQGLVYRPMRLPTGHVFPIFADRPSALAAMAAYDGHGWVVLCSVPTGIRAVSEAVGQIA